MRPKANEGLASVGQIELLAPRVASVRINQFSPFVFVASFLRL
jgi:hypothetical protein